MEAEEICAKLASLDTKAKADALTLALEIAKQYWETKIGASGNWWELKTIFLSKVKGGIFPAAVKELEHFLFVVNELIGPRDIETGNLFETALREWLDTITKQTENA